jgi:hypothetical protein
MTRAFDLVLHGHFAEATAMHPLVWIVAPFVALWLAIEILGYVRTGTWGASGDVRGFTPALVTLAALLFVVWLARFFGALGGPVPV